MAKNNFTKSVYNPLVDVIEVAEYLGLSVSTLNKWRCLGGGPKFLKLGRAVRYSIPDLQNYIIRRQVQSTSEYELGDL